MHASIYREFHVAISPAVDVSGLADPRAPADVPLFVCLLHIATGKEFAFELTNAAGSPERWIEEQVMRQFPTTAAAAELVALHGLTRHRLKAGWEHAFGDRLAAALSQCAQSAGIRCWAELIPTLPSVLYTTMSARAVEGLQELGAEMELRDVIKTVRDAWHAVLREARGVRPSVTGVERMVLDINGWPTEHMRNMSILEYGRFKEKAMFARLALGYLSDDDWVACLAPLLECATRPDSAAAGLATAITSP